MTGEKNRLIKYIKSNPKNGEYEQTTIGNIKAILKYHLK